MRIRRLMSNFYQQAVWKLIAVCCFGIVGMSAPAAEQQPPNVLVIAIDDLNDWVGCLGEHPQVKTPHIDRLAKRGVLFENAHVQATFCAPSRISLLSGTLPTTSGCFEFRPRYDQADSLKEQPPWPLWMRRHGYATYGGGKIFHEGTGNGWTADSFETIIPSGRNPKPNERMNWPVPVWDWGPYPDQMRDMGDYTLAKNVHDLLQQKQDRPFLMVAGFRRPHVPLHVPVSWFNMYPQEQVSLPLVPADDLDDVPHPEIGLTPHRAPLHAEILKQELWKSLTQAYLASISFVDHCVGEVLNGLDSGPHANNTVVILWSDHGFHLGEKQHWAKRTLWEETTRVPFIIAGPGVANGKRIQDPVGLIDIYPTLIELTGTKSPGELEGYSLVSMLNGESSGERPPVTTSLTMQDHSVRSRHYRYIRYHDGTEELYDHRTDADEFQNLAADPNMKSVITRLKQHLPQQK